MPTFLPGCMRVPRWRTIILPARIDREPNILTPSRLDSESRPLRDEPPAFLCAIYIAFIPQWKPFHYRLCRCAVLYSSADGRRVLVMFAAAQLKDFDFGMTPLCYHCGSDLRMRHGAKVDRLAFTYREERA